MPHLEMLRYTIAIQMSTLIVKQGFITLVESSARKAIFVEPLHWMNVTFTTTSINIGNGMAASLSGKVEPSIGERLDQVQAIPD